MVRHHDFVLDSVLGHGTNDTTHKDNLLTQKQVTDATLDHTAKTELK
jgi:hypothetical protein